MIDCVLPLARAAEAHRRMQAREHVGKIVLRVALSTPQGRVLQMRLSVPPWK